MLMEIPMNRAKARNEAPRLREVACSRLRKLEQSLFVKKTDPQACLWIRIARRDQDPHREKSSFHKTSLPKGNRTFDRSWPFSNSMLDKVQRVVPRHARQRLRHSKHASFDSDGSGQRRINTFSFLKPRPGFSLLQFLHSPASACDGKICHTPPGAPCVLLKADAATGSCWTPR